jgi:tRNA uridine 5-carboxymethylaminomethyl modification enzyme
MGEQPGDRPTPLMSFMHEHERAKGGENAVERPRQVSCYITQTNEKTHEIILGALDRSPLYTGVIEGTGPRYCPSIEDKVVRFQDRIQHQVFVEPEGLTTSELYPNGISTSLPFDVQIALVRSIRGFENAHITRPGYAIEYDFFDPRDLEYSLETKAVEGLFFAGQINGTTGYEEAGAQGLLAGLNAARKASGTAPWWPKRDEAYLGVLIDDLITLGTNEPYRMFTSRAEFRLRLREDNADQRLTPVGRELGLVGLERWQAFQEKTDAIAALRSSVEKVHLNPGTGIADSIGRAAGEAITKETPLAAFIRRPGVTLAAIAPELHRHLGIEASPDILSQLEIETKYEGYIRRQEEEISRVRRHESISLPVGTDFRAVSGLSTELVEKLAQVGPRTLAQASRIPGMTPAALSLLLVHARKVQGVPLEEQAGENRRTGDLAD